MNTYLVEWLDRMIYIPVAGVSIESDSKKRPETR